MFSMDQDSPERTFPSETDVDAILYEFKGDAREAIRALLHDLDALAHDYETDVSRGYVRSARPWIRLRRF